MARLIRTGFETSEYLSANNVIENPYPYQTSRFFGDLVTKIYDIRNSSTNEGYNYSYRSVTGNYNQMLFKLEPPYASRTPQRYIASRQAPDSASVDTWAYNKGGVFQSAGVAHYRMGLGLDLNKVSDGLFCNWWYTHTNPSIIASTNTNDVGLTFRIAALRTASNEYHVAFKTKTAGQASLIIQSGTTSADNDQYNGSGNNDMVEVAVSSSAVWGAADNQYSFMNFKWGVDAAGVLTASFNGQQIEYDTGHTFDQWIDIAFVSDISTYGGWNIDDMAVNDGSGSEHNSMPSSIRGYLAPFDLVENSLNYTTVGGADLLTTLTDNSNTTYITADVAPASVELSVAPLSAYVPPFMKVAGESGGSQGWGWVAADSTDELTAVALIKPEALGVTSTQNNRQLTFRVKDTILNNELTSSAQSLVTAPTNYISHEFDQGSSGPWNLTNLEQGNYTVKFEIN